MRLRCWKHASCCGQRHAVPTHVRQPLQHDQRACAHLYTKLQERQGREGVEEATSAHRVCMFACHLRKARLAWHLLCRVPLPQLPTLSPDPSLVVPVQLDGLQQGFQLGQGLAQGGRKVGGRLAVGAVALKQHAQLEGAGQRAEGRGACCTSCRIVRQ